MKSSDTHGATEQLVGEEQLVFGRERAENFARWDEMEIPVDASTKGDLYEVSTFSYCCDGSDGRRDLLRPGSS